MNNYLLIKQPYNGYISNQQKSMDDHYNDIKNSDLVNLVHSPFGVATLMKQLNGSLASPVPHLDVFSAPLSEFKIKECPWSTVDKLQPGPTSNVFIVGWHDPFEPTNTQPEGPIAANAFDTTGAPYSADAQQTVYLAALTSIHTPSRTFTITNEFNQLGPGNSGGVVIVIFNNKPYILGFINSIVNGDNEQTQELRCVRSDSAINENTFPFDTPVFKIKRPSKSMVASFENKIMNHLSLSNTLDIPRRLQSIEGRYQYPNGYFYDQPNPKENHWQPKQNGCNFDLRSSGLNQKEQVTYAIELAYQSFERLYGSSQASTSSNVTIPNRISQFTLIHKQGDHYQGPTNATYVTNRTVEGHLTKIRFNINFDHVQSASKSAPKTDHVGFSISIGSLKENGHILVDTLIHHHR